MKGEDKGFEVCGEVVQITANRYIFANAGQDFRLLLNCLYAYDKHGVLPFSGSFLANWAMNRDSYYAAWLLEDFSGVQDEDGNPHGITSFDLSDKAGLIEKLKEIDPKFSPWFASHCEAAEKKIKEMDAGGKMVEPGNLQGLQEQ